MRSINKLFMAGAASLVALALSAPASASSVVGTDCISVAHADGCLFSGNINGNTNPANANSYLNAQNAYNTYNNSVVTAQPDITLNWITKTDDANFGTFGSITGSTGTSSGTWSLPGWTVDYIAVKASNGFVLYQLAAPGSSGSWDTFDIPFNQNPHNMSHIAFFGQPVPEPAQWAMMIGGFGLVGGVMRRRKDGTQTVLA